MARWLAFATSNAHATGSSWITPWIQHPKRSSSSVLGLSPYVNLDLAFLALVGYLLLSIFVFISTYVSGEFKISYGRFGPTEIRAVAILANTVIFFLGNPTLHILNWNVQLYNLLLGFVTVVLYTIFVVSTILRARQLNEMEKRDQG